jgi:hypothetical protein
VVLGFELRALYLLGRHSTPAPISCALGTFKMGLLHYCLGYP